MSDNEIQISFTEQEVHDMVHGGTFPREIRAKFEAALPPEYAEGTVAWVTQQPCGVTYRRLAQRLSGRWVTDTEGEACLSEDSVTKVEPLRVLADDEIAVKRVPDLSADDVRALLRSLRTCRAGHYLSREVVKAYIDALDAETKP